jgi:hypothetical protein
MIGIYMNMKCLRAFNLWIFVISMTILQTSYSDELRLSFSEAKKQGFKIHILQNSQKTKSTQLQHQRINKQRNSLDKYKRTKIAWPFELPYNEGFMGNNFAQYQPYEIPGYHGGSDMVLERDSWIYAPVSGILEAGHYAYTDNPDGRRIKHWKPWPASGDPSYFEIAVIDDQGNRFELHHVDKASLPSDIIEKLNSGRAQVTAGTKVGRVVRWTTPFHYDHVHVNIHDHEGQWFNPEYFFENLPDTIKPECQFLLVYKNGKSEWLQNVMRSRLNPEPDEISHFAIIASDKKNNNKFSQVPTYFEVSFQEGEKFFWDFNKNLTSSNSNFADIRNVYLKSVKLPNGQNFRQPSGYYPNGVKFAVQLPLPMNTGSGKYFLKAQDHAGNFCEYQSQLY